MSEKQEPQPQQAAPVAVPAEIAAIIKNLHTQDNRITDNPLFAVQQNRRVYGLDEDYEAAHGWFHPDRDSFVVEGGPEFAELEAAWESGEEPKGGWRRVGFKDTWEFVTGCLTEQGCKDYIACNGHNLHEPRIYAYGSYRNAEFIALRKWLMSLAASPQAAQAPTIQELSAGAHYPQCSAYQPTNEPSPVPPPCVTVQLGAAQAQTEAVPRIAALPDPPAFPVLASMAEQLRHAIDIHREGASTAQAVGVLEIIKHQLIQEQQ